MGGLRDILQGKLATVAPAPDRTASTRMVDEKMPHGSGGHGKELRAVGPFDRRRTADEPEVHFVDERRRLERLIARLAPKTLIRHATKLVIHQRQQPRGSLAVAPVQIRKDLRYFAGNRHDVIPDRARLRP